MTRQAVRATRLVLGAALLVAPLLLAPGLARAATQADAEAALAAARHAEDGAHALRNEWVPTQAALQQAATQLAAGHYDDALAAAQRARALAERSIQQAQEQGKLWQDEVVR